jgi:fatty acid desaturase
MNTTQRDYSLLGPEGERAVANGLANAEWYRTPVERKRMKQLMQRSDGPAIRNTLLFIGLIGTFGAIGVLSWGKNWFVAVPAFFIYGTLWGSGGDARCHEAGHGTAFRTKWMNEAVFQMGCFMTLREPLVRRWDHTRHHTDTVIVGRDREIVEPCPPSYLSVASKFLALPFVWGQLKSTVHHTVTGRLAADEKLIIPESEWSKVIWQARLIAAIHVGVIAWSLATGSLLPLMLFSLPAMYGAWFMAYVAFTQHVALAEDVTDFRLNTRTIYMNPVFRFLYWNMNYHLEHHMFPMVPFHSLKDLHEEIKADCPPAYESTLQAYAEILPTWRAQRSDSTHFVHRELLLSRASS